MQSWESAVPIEPGAGLTCSVNESRQLRFVVLQRLRKGLIITWFILWCRFPAQEIMQCLTFLGILAKNCKTVNVAPKASG